LIRVPLRGALFDHRAGGWVSIRVPLRGALLDHRALAAVARGAALEMVLSQKSVDLSTNPLVL
jgi:hypothetical protein